MKLAGLVILVIVSGVALVTTDSEWIALACLTINLVAAAWLAYHVFIE
jgi:hypothetical protein